MAIKLIIADDAPFILQVTRSLLEGEAIDIIAEASNGEEVVEKALDLKPDAIFMDMVMPIKNGTEAAREILAQLPQTKIIAFSTLDEDIMKQKALDAGCVAYINKPFNRNDLINSLKNAFNEGQEMSV